MKRFLAMLLAVLMIVSLLPTAALAAEGDVAKIGDTGYATLQAAVNAANEGDTVKLLANVELSSAYISITKGITVDFGEFTVSGVNCMTYPQALVQIKAPGKTVTFKGTTGGIEVLAGDYGTRAIAIESGSKLVIESGVYSSMNNCTIYADNAGAELVINGGTIQTKSNTTSGNYKQSVTIDGNLTVTGGTIINEAASSSQNLFQVDGANSKVSISGANITAKAGTVVKADNSAVEVEIKNCAVTTTSGALANGGNVTIGEGTNFESTSGRVVSGAASATIEGGSFKTENAFGYSEFPINVEGGEFEVKNLTTNANSTNLKISGGDFDIANTTNARQVVEKYIAPTKEDGKVEVTVNDKTYEQNESGEVVEKEPVTPAAKIGDVEYASLQEAVNAANEGDTVKLLANVELSSAYISITKGITVDFGEFTVSGVNCMTYPQALVQIKAPGKTVTFKGTTGGIEALAGDYGTRAIAIESGSKLVIESGVYSSMNNCTIYADNAGAELVINGGTIQTKSNTTSGNYKQSVTIDGNLTVTGGTIINEAASSSQNLFQVDGANSKVSISGANITAKAGTVVKADNSAVEVEIKNCAVTTTSGALANGGNVTIGEGTNFESTSGRVVSGAASATIEGGSFKTENAFGYSEFPINVEGGEFEVKNLTTNANSTNLKISGGDFDIANTTNARQVVEKYIAPTKEDGKVEVTVNDKTYTKDESGEVVEKIDAVAQIGDQKYETLAEAFAAAEAGDVLEILVEGEYTLPASLPNITIKGVDGVKFNCVGTGSICSIPNGATFENVEFDFGQNNYHGFQHAGTINMNNCKLNGLLFSYGDMNFTGCTFNQTKAEYCMWLYGEDVTFDTCTFNGYGKFFNVYNEGNSPYSVTAKNCTANNLAETGNKAVFNVKETCGDTILNTTVEIQGANTYNGAVPVSKDTQVVYNCFVQADDFAATKNETDGIKIIAEEGTTLKVNGEAPAAVPEEIYETEKLVPAVAKIGDVEYATLTEALAAAKSGDEVELLKDIDGEAFIVVENGVKLDLAGHSITGAKLIYVSGSMIDSSTTKGTVSASGYVLPDGKDGELFYLPIYTGTGYQFYNLMVGRMWNANNSQRVDFALSVSNGETLEACKLLTQGYDVSRVKATVTVTWDNGETIGEQTFTYKDNFLKTFANAPKTTMLYVAFTGLDDLTGVSVQVRFTSYNDAGKPIASVCSAPLAYN